MKEKELRDNAKCSLCGNGLMTKGNPLFAIVTVKTQVIDLRAIQRQAGLEMIIGDVAIAQALSPNENMTKDLNTVTATICYDCFMKKTTIEELLENGT